MLIHTTTHLPEQKSLPFIGGLPLLGNLPDMARDRLTLFRRMARVSDVCGMHFGPFPCVLFNKPEHVQSILVKQTYAFDKGVLNRVLRPVIGDGLLSSEGALHRHQRKLMAPSFQPGHIAGYAESMGAYGEKMQRSWSENAVIDLDSQMNTLTMSIIGKALFGTAEFSENDELGAAMMVLLDYVSHSLSTPFQWPYSWPTLRNRRMHAAEKILRAHMRQFIDRRRAQPAAYQDILSVLLQARDEDGQPMSDERLMSECLTFFGAGYETTAAALSWTWYLLCQHPEIYQRVQREVDTVLQGRTPTYADLERLPYCLQVFKEVLRLYPPSYVICRHTLDDIEIDGYRVSKGWTILVAPYTLHRRKEYFPEPEKFDPERFQPAREKSLPRYTYIPFGAGPHVCIGLHFAMMEGQLLLATLAQRTTFSLLPDQARQPDLLHNLVLRPTGMVQVRVTKR